MSKRRMSGAQRRRLRAYRKRVQAVEGKPRQAHLNNLRGALITCYTTVFAGISVNCVKHRKMVQGSDLSGRVMQNTTGHSMIRTGQMSDRDIAAFRRHVIAYGPESETLGERRQREYRQAHKGEFVPEKPHSERVKVDRRKL